MKHLALILMVSASAFAGSNAIVDETFKTTFSDYNQLDTWLTCTPGYQGGFATADTLHLHSHTIELGFDVRNEPFHADSRDALEKEGFNLPPRRRPYELGCKPALEKFKKALEGKELVEVEVHRQVVETSTNDSRVNRNRKGDVNFQKWMEIELRHEIYEVAIAGFEFQIFRSINGKSRDL